MTSGLEKSDSRMVIGARGIENLGTIGIDDLFWPLEMVDRLRTNGNALVFGLADGLFFGPPVFGPPPEYKVLRRSQPGLKPSHNWKYLDRAQNLAGFGMLGMFYEFDDFTKGVAWASGTRSPASTSLARCCWTDHSGRSYRRVSTR